MKSLLFPSLLLLLLAAVAPPLSASEDEETAPPTDEETLLLELVNRARADPAAAAERIAETVSGAWPWTRPVDWEKFRRELGEIPPAPPVFFNPRLLGAARRHSDYLHRHYRIGAGVSGHVEVPGLAGFTGEHATDRAREAGYRGGIVAENISYHPDIRQTFAQIAVDWSNRTEDGMQPGRGHRKILFAPEFREFGFANRRREENGFGTWMFGAGVARMVGGVVYRDEDGDGFYDPGEGIGDVPVSVEGRGRTRTGPSGAWSLVVGSGAVRVSAQLEDLLFSASIPEGDANVKFDVVPIDDSLLAALDRRIADAGSVSRTPAASARDRRILLDLYDRTRDLKLDDARRSRVKELTEKAVHQAEEAKKRVRARLSGPVDDEVDREVRDLAYDYRRTWLETWFENAADAARAAARHARLLAAPDEFEADRRERAAADLETVAGELATKEWGDWLRARAATLR